MYKYHHTDGVILGIQKISQHLKISCCNYQPIDPRRISMKYINVEIAFDKMHCPFIDNLLTSNRNLLSLIGNPYHQSPPATCIIFIVEKLKLSMKIRNRQDITSHHYFSILNWKFKLIQ